MAMGGKGSNPPAVGYTEREKTWRVAFLQYMWCTTPVDDVYFYLRCVCVIWRTMGWTVLLRL